jgi:hypothetical protein
MAPRGWRGACGPRRPSAYYLPSVAPPGRRVERAPHPEPAAIQHVRVDHRRADVPVPQQLLDRPDVVPISSNWVANEWRRTWGLAGLLVRATRLAA